MLAHGKGVNERTASCAFRRLLVLGCFVMLSIGVASASENEIMDFNKDILGVFDQIKEDNVKAFTIKNSSGTNLLAGYLLSTSSDAGTL